MRFSLFLPAPSTDRDRRRAATCSRFQGCHPEFRTGSASRSCGADSHGRLITKMGPLLGEFSVFYENGVRQEIRSFRLVHGSEVRAQDVEARPPETTSMLTVTGEAPHPPLASPLRTVNVVCLVLNDLTPDTRAFAFDAARKFVMKKLRPDTFVGVFTLDSARLGRCFRSPTTGNIC